MPDSSQGMCSCPTAGLRLIVVEFATIELLSNLAVLYQFLQNVRLLNLKFLMLFYLCEGMDVGHLVLEANILMR